MKDGTARLFTVDNEDAGTRLDVFLTACTGLSRSRVKNMIKDSCTVLNGEVCTKPSYPVETGDRIELFIPSASEPDFLPEQIPLDIVYEDKYIIVVNKPAGLVVHPARGNIRGTLAAGLLYHCKSLEDVGDHLKPGIVHRLDMGTSGLLVAALKEESHVILSRMVHDREVQRCYTTFVWGHPEPRAGTVDAPIGRHPKIRTLNAVVQDGRPSVTHYKTSARYEFISMLEVTLQTGRTHQIRVHMASIGHHVFGDPSYGGREKRLKGFSPEIRDRARYLLKGINRQALHAVRLEFDHPVTGEALSFEAPFPDDIAWLQEKLEQE